MFFLRALGEGGRGNLRRLFGRGFAWLAAAEVRRSAMAFLAQGVLSAAAGG